MKHFKFNFILYSYIFLTNKNSTDKKKREQFVLAPVFKSRHWNLIVCMCLFVIGRYVYLKERVGNALNDQPTHFHHKARLPFDFM